MVKKMEDNGKIKEMKIGKRKLFFKMMRLFLYRVRKRSWFLPDLDEITVDELQERMNSNSNLPLLLDTLGEK